MAPTLYFEPVTTGVVVMKVNLTPGPSPKVARGAEATVINYRPGERFA